VPLQRIYVLGDMVHREKCLTCACRHRAQPGWVEASALGALASVRKTMQFDALRDC
jgi:hypothetical protein